MGFDLVGKLAALATRSADLSFRVGRVSPIVRLGAAIGLKAEIKTRLMRAANFRYTRPGSTGGDTTMRNIVICCDGTGNEISQNITFISEALGRNLRLRVSTHALKSVDHNGGLDAFLLKSRAEVLSPKALELKRAIQKKVGTAAPEKKVS